MTYNIIKMEQTKELLKTPIQTNEIKQPKALTDEQMQLKKERERRSHLNQQLKAGKLNGFTWLILDGC